MTTLNTGTVDVPELTAADLLAALSVAPDAIVFIDAAQRIISFNRAAERVFGYDAGEVVGQPFQLLLGDRSRRWHRLEMARFARSLDRTRVLGDRGEVMARRRDGSEFTAEGSISKFYRGGHWTYTAVLRDVTARNRRERAQRLMAEMGIALAASLDCRSTIRAFSGLVAEHVADACVVALNGNDCCPALLDVAHRDPAREDFAREQFDAHGPPPLLLETMATGVPSLLAAATAEQLVPEGAAPDLEALVGTAPSCIAVPLVARGRAVGAAVLLSASPRSYDWSDVEVAEELSRRAGLAIDNDRLYTSATGALKAHEETLSFVAHDLRNPLNVILMAAQLLLERAPAGDEFARDWLGRITRSAEQMEGLIRDLLTAARSTGGRPVLHTARTQVDRLVNEAAAEHEHAAARKGVRLEVRPPDPALAVLVDLDTIVRALSNLVGNAVKFTPPGGGIDVAAERVGDEVHFSVSDTGPGIPEHHLPHVFDRFWQAPGTQRGGAGLGLAIVKGAVEAHDGRVWIDTRVGQGSTFSIAIPLAPS